MKTLNLKIIFSLATLVLSALACATPDVNALLNPMPTDDFSNSKSGWGTGTDTQSSVEYSNGGLQFAVYQPYYVTWSTPSLDAYENSHIEVNVKNSSIDDQSFFGIICNEQGSTNDFYYAGVSPDGYYAFNKSHVVGKDEVLKEGNSDAIKASAQSMRIGLDCKNGSMTLYVNSQMIDSVSDSTYTKGSFGVFAASDDQQNGTTVIFDDFASSKLDK